MGLGIKERLTGSGKELSHFELRVMRPGSSRWETPEFEHDLGDLSGLQEPLDQQAVVNTAETEGWPSGKYKLQGRYTDGTMADTEWVFDHEGPEEADADRELTEEEKMAEAARQAARSVQERGPAIQTPDHAMGAIFEKTLDGEMPEDVDMGKLAQFVDHWQCMTSSAPDSPDDVAGQLYTAHMAEGNTQAATAILGEWFEAQGARQSDSSMIEMVKEMDDTEISMETIKALGVLRLVEDPRGMIRETTTGMLEAQASTGPPARGGGAGGGMRSLLEQGSFQGGQETPEEDVDETPVVESETPPEQPATGADLDIVTAHSPPSDEQQPREGA